MKRLIIITILLISIFHFKGYAQEEFGKTLNLGLGIGGYSRYYGYSPLIPVFRIDYEIDVLRNFTLAPFISFYTFYYNYYHVTVVPIGVKGTYYFDELLDANSRWDFYLAASLGFAIVSSHWDSGYTGSRNDYYNPSPLYLNLHLGTEYHISNKVGVFLDLATDVSTIGLSIHHTK